MSRIDEAYRDAQRAAERKGVRQKEEERARQRQSETNAFAKLIPREPAGNEARSRVPPPGVEQPGIRAVEERRRDGLQRREGVDRRAREPGTGAGESESRSAAFYSEGMKSPGKAHGTDEDRADKDSESNSSETDHPLAGASSAFRFNPALMAPVPVATPKDSKSSERARAIATEIAQKIVERVRVGTDRSGRAEFQIDLRGDVLSGLSIRISAGNGKIQASFSASDRAVAKLLRKNADELKQALCKRGLTLEELRIEERT
jgi:flagellar hook-length control protein FliK